jgi:hypothetical protein
MTTISSTPKIGYAYDETDDTWYPLVSSGVASHSHSASIIVGLNLDSLSDVVISSATTGQGLVYDGSNFVNGEVASLNPLLLMGA